MNLIELEEQVVPPEDGAGLRLSKAMRCGGWEVQMARWPGRVFVNLRLILSFQLRKGTKPPNSYATLTVGETSHKTKVGEDAL